MCLIKEYLGSNFVSVVEVSQTNQTILILFQNMQMASYSTLVRVYKHEKTEILQQLKNSLASLFNVRINGEAHKLWQVLLINHLQTAANKRNVPVL